MTPTNLLAEAVKRATLYTKENEESPYTCWEEMAADLKTILTSLAAKDAALRQCRDQFAFCAHEHRAAGKETKALTNQRFADIAAQALGDQT